jgi:hypothetical protein
VGLYIRPKTVGVWPFRLTIGRSRVGWKVNVGVPGCRLVKDPRRGWEYQLGGRRSYWYRELGGRRVSPSSAAARSRGSGGPPAQSQGSEILLEDVTGAGATELVASPEVPDADALVAELNAAGGRWRWWPAGVLATVAVVGALAVGRLGVDWSSLALLAGGVAVTVWLALRDLGRRSVVVLYELEDDDLWSASLVSAWRRLGLASMMRLALRTRVVGRSAVVSCPLEGPQAEWFQSLVEAWRGLTGVTALWRVRASGRLDPFQSRENGGRETQDGRVLVGVGLKGSGILVTNVEVPSVIDEDGERDHELYFLPDVVLIREGAHFAAMSYAALEVEWQSVRFVEDDGVPVPGDAESLGTTWKYITVKGEPNLSYTRQNRPLPVMRYGRMELRSESGLRWILFSSQAEVARCAVERLRSTG